MLALTFELLHLRHRLSSGPAKLAHSTIRRKNSMTIGSQLSVPRQTPSIDPLLGQQVSTCGS